MKLSWERFGLNFAGAFGTGRAALVWREGVILRLEGPNQLFGLGEAAPLPEFGGGTVEDVLALLQTISPSLKAVSPDELLAQLPQIGPGMQALRCGLDTALGDWLAQSEGKSLAAWLTGGGRVAESVPVNATIGAPDNAKAAEQARQAVENGFGCVKLKVGMAASVAGEVERVAAVRAVMGQRAKLRLDANGAWSVAQAIATLHNLEEFDLELVEQPVAAEDVAGLATVRRAINVPIAADEAVTGLDAARAIIAANAADILVIKPMVVGGLRTGREIIEMAQAAGLKSFVTTTIDSGVGIAAALHLAATLPEPVLACGLATASLLEDTLVQELPEVRGGRMYLPKALGLGVALR